MLLKYVAYLVPIAGLAVIGLLTFLKNPREKVNALFFGVALSMAAWLLALFVGDLTISQPVSLWAVRVATCVGTLIIPAVLYFSVYFPVRINKIRRYFHLLAIAPAALFMVLALTPLLIPAVEFEGQSAQPAQLNILYTLQSVYFVAGMLAGFLIMLRKLRHIGARERAQIRLVIAGLVTALVINIATGFVFTTAGISNDYSNLAGSMSLLIFIGATAYAIIRHRLFDLRLAIVRTFGFTVTIGLVSIAYSLLALAIGEPLISDGHIIVIRSAPQLLLFLPPTLLAALTFHSLERFIAQHTRNLFYQDSYDTRSTLDKLSDALISDNDLGKIAASGLAAICAALRPSHVLFVVIDDAGTPSIQQRINRNEPMRLESLVEKARSLENRIITKDEVPAGRWQHEFEQEDISLVLRLGTPKNPIGILFFGPKQNGRIYTKQDIDLLGVSAKNFGIAIENAKKYQQIAHFADTMHAEVLRATASLRAANTKLKTLDAMKDDFISMASHQLRSPAASVHDAIKMLEQTYLTPAERKKIVELADASSERLLNVVTDMLSVARIQAGHFTIEKTEVGLEELVDRAILQASGLSAEKHITIRFERPDMSPKIMADRAKINEIISNYIENAIKYSQDKSQIRISLRRTPEKVYFEVVDHGIGVPKEERKSLFNKFYRATNARKEQPNGNGIGLFVVKTVVNTHGGDVYYEPQPDGSLFGFWLPSE